MVYGIRPLLPPVLSPDRRGVILSAADRDDCRCLLLCMDKVIKNPSPAHQFFVRTHLRNLTVVQHNEPIRVAEGGEPVRDGKGCAPLDQSGDGGLNLFLCGTVKGRGRLVEDQNFWVM